MPWDVVSQRLTRRKEQDSSQKAAVREESRVCGAHLSSACQEWEQVAAGFPPTRTEKSSASSFAYNSPRRGFPVPPHCAEQREGGLSVHSLPPSSSHQGSRNPTSHRH
ncbi:uncharacterized protein WM294_006873 isoform 1-T1 [Sarcoramphus papa]